MKATTILVVLWTHAIEALRRASPAVARSVPPDTVVAPVVDAVLPRLVNELDGQGPITLILDDVHRLSSVPARASVRWFIDHAPPEFQLVLASRTEPALPVSALRAHGELLELRADDLRFTCEEADAFLNGRLALGLTREDVEGLVAKTEGWPAGLISPRCRCSTLPTGTLWCASSAARTVTWWISW